MSPRLPIAATSTKPVPLGIRCPDCGKPTKVIRRREGNGYYVRRRACVDDTGCGWRFNTTERTDEGQ